MNYNSIFMKKVFVLFLSVFSTMLYASPVEDGTKPATETAMNAQEQILHALDSQTYDGQLTLTLLEAQQYAIEHNRSLQNASLEVKKAHAQRWQTIAAMLPQVDASGQYVNMCGYQMTLGPMPIAMPSYIAGGITASVGLNGQAIVGALLNTLAIEMQDISREQSESELRANVMNAYMAVLVMEDVVKLMESSLENITTLADQTTRMVEVGAAEQTQADQMRVRVNALKNNINNNRLNVELAYNSLRVLLDVSADTRLILADKIDDVLNAGETLNLLRDNFNIHNNHNYQLLEKNVELAKKNVHMAGWAYGPTIGLQYQYNPDRYYFSDEKGFNMNPTNMVAVSISMPIWSSGKRAAGVTEKKIALQEARNTLSETTDNLSIQHNQLRYTLANSYETYVNEKENITVTQRVMDNVVNKYNWGAASMLELTNASNDMISAQSTYVQAVLSLVQAYVALDQFLNNPK